MDQFIGFIVQVLLQTHLEMLEPTASKKII